MSERTLSDLEHYTEATSRLRAQLAQVTRERDELREAVLEYDKAPDRDAERHVWVERVMPLLPAPPATTEGERTEK